MEIAGTERSKDMASPFLSIKRSQLLPIDYLCTAIVKGRWTKEAIELLQENNIKVKLKKRKVESKFSSIFDLVKHWLAKFKNLKFKK